MVPLAIALGLWLMIVSLASFFIVRSLPVEEAMAVAKVVQAQAEAQPVPDQEFVQRLEAVMKSYVVKRLKEGKKVQAKKENRVEARRVKRVKLENLLPVEKAFYFNNPARGEGTFVRSLEEFLETLKEAPQEVVDFHMREDVNDFENWMRNVIKDIALADELKRIKEEKGADRDELVKAVEKRLKTKKMFVKNLKQPRLPGYA